MSRFTVDQLVLIVKQGYRNLVDVQQRSVGSVLIEG